MFKSWQIFVFTLVPLALVLTGVIVGSMHGVDSEQEVFAPPPPSADGNGAPAPTAPAGTTTIQLVAENLAFDQSSLSAPAGEPVQVTLDNRDAAVIHNFSVYTDRSAEQETFIGDTVTGPDTISYDFDAPQPGSYFFRCDIHPDTMTGSFTTS